MLGPLVPGIVALLGIAVLTGALIRRPPIAPLRTPLLLCALCAGLWTAGETLASLAETPEAKWPALVLLYTGSIPLTPVWWIVVVRWLRIHGRRLAPAWEYLPLAAAALLWLAMVTDPWHGRFLTPRIGARNVYHEGFWAVVGINYAISLASTLLCLRLAHRQLEPEVRRASITLGIAPFVLLSGNALYVLSPWNVPAYLTWLSLVAVGALTLIAVLRSARLWRLPAPLTEILRHDPNGVILANPSGRVFYCNAAAESRLADLPLAPNLDLFSVLAPRLRDAGDGEAVADRSALESALWRAGGSGRVYRYGDSWLWLSVAPIPGRRRRTLALAVRVIDVSALWRAERERRALQAQVEESERLRGLGVLAGGIAHDFNNRLTTILGNAGLVLEDLDADGELAAMLRDVEESALDASRLTQQLLAAAGRAPLSAETIDLSEVASAVAGSVEPELPTGVRLRRQLAADVPPLRADAELVGQILARLVRNAVEAIGSGPGWIVLRTGAVELRDPADSLHLTQPLPPGPYAFAEVSDSGRGMDPETRRRAFEPFFSTRAGGRGLGLSVASGIVHAHGGALEVESAPGRGSTFRVLLPCAAKEGLVASHDQPQASAADDAWRGRGLALVVDDEAGVRRVAAAMLGRLGFDVLEADGGVEAIALFEHWHARLRFTLLDLAMPGLSGEETLRGLCRLDPEARVLLSSGFAPSDALRRIARDARTGFVAKPYRRRDLAAAVRALIEP